MKKKIFALLTSCCFLLPTLSACLNDGSTEPEKKDDVICSFESVEEVTTLYGGDIFGKKLYSSEEKYVTDGKGCMYMEIDADFDFIARENIWHLDSTIEFIEPHLRFTSTKFDFSDVEGVYGFAIDVYNASEKDIISNRSSRMDRTYHPASKTRVNLHKQILIIIEIMKELQSYGTFK